MYNINFNGFKTRSPWASAIIGLIFGPFMGMLYLKRGKLAFNYFWFLLVVLVLPFVLAHLGILAFDPRKVTTVSGWVVHLVGAVHCFLVAEERKDTSIKWYAHWYSFALILIVPFMLGLAFRGYGYEPFSLPTRSMEPALHLGDYLFVNKHIYNASHSPNAAM